MPTKVWTPARARKCVSTRFSDTKYTSHAEWYVEYDAAVKFLSTTTFNDEQLFSGDAVIAVFGKHLRHSVVESIDEVLAHQPAIKLKGLSKRIHSRQIIKL